MAAYRSKAINTIVQIDVFPNKEPVIAYNSHANGPNKIMFTIIIHFKIVFLFLVYQMKLIFFSLFELLN